MTDSNIIYELIMLMTLVFVVILYFLKIIIAITNSGIEVNARNIEYMEMKTIGIDVGYFVLKAFIVIFLNVWLYQATNLRISHRMSEQESQFITFVILIISVLNTVLITSLISSLLNSLGDILIRLKQKKNTVQNNLIKAIHFGNIDDIVYYYKLINQQNPRFNRPILIERNSGAELLLTQNYWLMVLSALMKTDEIEEAKILSEKMRGQRVVKHGSPLKRFKSNFN